jgi:hypothetical protein
MQAMKSSNQTHWEKAVAEELRNLENMKVWLAREIPPNRKPLRGHWVLAEKSNDSGEVICYKARFVAKQFPQLVGVDYAETFAPTATFVSMRLILTLAAKYFWPVFSFDFVEAYLNAPIDEEVWVKAPDGLPVRSGKAMLLDKALYGTKQATQCWWLHLLSDLVFTSNQYNNSLYTIKHDLEHSIAWVHVDNIIVTGSLEKLLKKLKEGLKGLLKIKWSKGLESKVGLEIKWNSNAFQLRKPKLINQLLEKHWDGAFTQKTLLPPSLELITEPNGDPSQLTEFLSLVGFLSYLAVGSCLDIAYAVNTLACFSAKPGTNLWKGIKNLIAYIANSKDFYLNLYLDSVVDSLKCFCNTSWGEEFAKSMCGILVTFFGCPVMWTSWCFPATAASTCHAEYMALGIGTRQVLRVQHLLTDILRKLFTGLLHCNNQEEI